MKPKYILISIFIALVVIVLFNNKEEASFWLFGDIRTSKLFIVGAFFLLGVIIGGLIFGRHRAHPKEYSISIAPPIEEDVENEKSSLSEEDRRYLSNN